MSERDLMPCSIRYTEEQRRAILEWTKHVVDPELRRMDLLLLTWRIVAFGTFIVGAVMLWMD
jgi:hypothetical protein